MWFPIWFESLWKQSQTIARLEPSLHSGLHLGLQLNLNPMILIVCVMIGFYFTQVYPTLESWIELYWDLNSL